MKKLSTLALVFLASLVCADGYVNNAVAVTDVSQTISFTGRDSSASMYAKSVSVLNYARSKYPVYVWAFTTEETATAATTSDHRLDPGDAITFNFDENNETGVGYRDVSLVCASDHTATIRIGAK